MIKSSIGHVTSTALPSLPPLGVNAPVIGIAAFVTVHIFPSSHISWSYRWTHV